MIQHVPNVTREAASQNNVKKSFINTNFWNKCKTSGFQWWRLKSWSSGLQHHVVIW